MLHLSGDIRAVFSSMIPKEIVHRVIVGGGSRILAGKEKSSGRG